ncbi:lipoprotein B transmembrane [Sulfuricella denitrificans skB26]|uniref:LPS-assembly lipoprotein LptE n=1 Tax=Sulfuricella denitrificans (strain DSM 22764 / NBRC 105220 / skB26) TaxID=1163617 RepID=S6AAN4_SULDS|nr:LPS assembly lipoprotein LptE [Sulfuricella denitrificans]BAN33903.1 lipoprotein B transmembrane [Sulfuricella denitrificans skB26]
MRNVLTGFILTLLLAACGFQLRGVATLPFESLYVDGSGNPALAAEIGRAISSGTQTKLTDKAEDAQAVLQVQGATIEKRILALSGAGRVREYELIYRVGFRLTDKEGRNLITPQPIEMRRAMLWDDALVLAKQGEEALLYADMQKDVIGQLMRRLAKAKPQFADVTP